MRYTLVALTAAMIASASCTAGGVVNVGGREDAAGHDAAMLGPDASAPDSGSQLPDADNDANIGLNPLVAIVISPADPVFSCADVADPTPMQVFTAMGTLLDGRPVPITVGTWSIRNPRLGAMREDGVFSGVDGCVASGRTQVEVEVPDGLGGVVRASTSLTIRVSRQPVLVGLTTADDPAAHFAGTATTDTSREAHVLYPLDGTVMPNNVLPPDIQWERGASGDIYRVSLTSSTMTMTAYVRHSGSGFHFDWTADRDLWRLAAESYTTDPISIAVDRWDSAADAVIAGTPLSLNIARSSIAGHVYYWDVGSSLGSEGRILRIDAFSGARDVVIPSPPRSCIGCHAISPNGRYMSVMVGGGDPSARGTVYDLSTDLTAPSAPSLFPPPFSDPNGMYFAASSWSPDGTRLFDTTENIQVVDPFTGMLVPVTGLPTTGRYYAPAWSPDGSTVAMGSMVGGVFWHDGYSQGDLVVMPVTASDAFGPVSVLHSGNDLASAPEGGQADSHPTWSPDSSVIAFQHGTHDRSDHYAQDVTQWSSCALYVVQKDGSSPVRLDAAVGGSTATRNYWPTFSPFETSEGSEFASYYWLAFTSGRSYGNAQAGTAGGDHRQIWVTAVRVGETPGVDPSSVPYWLPGQDTAGQNIGAQWAPVACRATGDECTTSSECCSGNCALTPGTGDYACQPPPPAECRARGTTCGSDGDCCSGLLCVGNTCVDMVF